MMAQGRHVRAWLSALLLTMLVCGLMSSAWADDAKASENTANTSSDETQNAVDNGDTSTDNDASVRILNPGADSIQIGQPVHMRIHVDVPERGRLVSLQPVDNPFVEVVGQPPIPDNSPRTDFTVTVFRPGTYTFAVEAVWVDADGSQQRTKSSAIQVRVLESVEDHETATLKPPGPFVTLRSRNLWLIFGGSAALLSAFGLLCWGVWRRFRRAPAPEVPAAPPRLAWEVALASIDALRADRALLYEEPVQFHQRISEILRIWLEGRFEIRAPEMTSEEILSELRPRRLSLGRWIDQIQAILADSDLVKFAKFIPSAENSHTLLQQLEDLVREVQESDSSPPPNVPMPIASDEQPVQESEHLSSQQHQPGVAEPRYVPEAAEKPNVLSLDFGSRRNPPTSKKHRTSNTQSSSSKARTDRITDARDNDVEDEP